MKGTVNGTTVYEVSTPSAATTGTTQTTIDPGVASGTAHAALETQRAAVYTLATALQADTTVSSSAKITGTFTDVVMGVVSGMGASGGGHDTAFPFTSGTEVYPTGTTGRGVLYTSLSAAEQADVLTMIQAWVNTQASDINSNLLATYESTSALAQTYVAYAPGTGGTADFSPFPNQETTPLSSQHSYIRIDGPRVWIEFVVQEAVAFQSESWVHYHSIWRDKLADYGDEFGAAITATSPAITTQPAAMTLATGGTGTLSVVATGTATLTYQWYFNSTAISGATGASYTITSATSANAGNYYVVVTSPYGIVTSSTAAVTVTPPVTAPDLVSVASVQPHAGTNYSIDLPLTGSEGVEGRSINNTLQLLFTFDGSITMGTVSSTAGTIGKSTYSGYTMTVNLTNVADIQDVIVTLSGLNGTTSSVYITFGVLQGDVNGDGVVNALDLIAIRNALGTTTSSSTFVPQDDITEDGSVNALDLIAIRNSLGNSIP